MPRCALYLACGCAKARLISRNCVDRRQLVPTLPSAAPVAPERQAGAKRVGAGLGHFALAGPVHR